MKKRSYSPILILAMLLALASSGCDTKKDDNSKNMLLMMLMDAMSGSCVVSQKYPSGPYFFSTGSQIPKGGCVDANTYHTSAAAAVSDANAQLDVLIGLYTAAGASCSTMVTQFTFAKTNQTEVNVQTSALGATPKCAVLVTATKNVVYCTDATEMANYKANFKYTVMSDVRMDLALLPHYTALVSASMTNILTNGFWLDAIAATVIGDAGYFSTVLRTFPGMAYSFAVVSTELACAATFLSDASLKAQVARNMGKNATLGITQADVDKVQSVVSYDMISAYPPKLGIFCCNGVGCPANSAGGYAIPNCSASSVIPQSW